MKKNGQTLKTTPDQTYNKCKMTCSHQKKKKKKSKKSIKYLFLFVFLIEKKHTNLPPISSTWNTWVPFLYTKKFNQYW